MKDELKSFYKGKKVLVTGHTGFKGSWLSIWLNELGANVIGYSDKIKTNEDNFVLSNLSSKIVDLRGDINDQKLIDSIIENEPEIIFHLAAQPLVLYSYEHPLETYMSNVIGTLNVLEAARKSNSVKSVVIITTDKCYWNNEWIWGYRENDRLGGYDPYSSSKACVEILVESYRKSYFNDEDNNISKGIATVRAGNVIGGGDWAENRIVTDSIKSLMNDEIIYVRNPYSTRPWQHVLEPLYGYLILGKRLYDEPQKYSQAFNFGPRKDSVLEVKDVVEKIISFYGKGKWKIATVNKPHEANLLTLDISKANTVLGWQPLLTIDKALKMTVDWYKKYKKCDVYKLCCKQIHKYENLMK